MSIKENQENLPWWNWPNALIPYIKAKKTDKENERIDFWCFVQYLFYQQWQDIRAYAHKRGIRILGDMPFYVSMDSCDVWCNPSLFQLDPDTMQPTAVAGVPPDYFSRDGQLWGNPLYHWENMKKDHYAWWMSRIAFLTQVYDIVRIDHFRAFASYWSVPACEHTAKNGEWKLGPCQDFFAHLSAQLPGAPLIAEDLGIIGDDVRKLLEYTNLPGMRVMQFGFGDGTENPHLPHQYPQNVVGYLGTHDSDTFLGFLSKLPPDTLDFVSAYCAPQQSSFDFHTLCQGAITKLWQSQADLVILCVQDMLGMDSSRRMNTPGTKENNWTFRMTREEWKQVDKNYYLTLNQQYLR